MLAAGPIHPLTEYLAWGAVRGKHEHHLDSDGDMLSSRITDVHEDFGICSRCVEIERGVDTLMDGDDSSGDATSFPSMAGCSEDGATGVCANGEDDEDDAAAAVGAAADDEFALDDGTRWEGDVVDEKVLDVGPRWRNQQWLKISGMEALSFGSSFSIRRRRSLASAAMDSSILYWAG